ncbi:MAG TPA: cupin domain-containing protein [Anaerolineales bacterium]|nr:cupin domain-containing protein [Anaerolineales bacterium]
MIRAGFSFEHPTTKTRTVVLESDAETSGMGWLLEVTRYSKLGSDLGEHLHLTWTETFEIIKGTAKYKLDGNERTAKAGESFVVEPGHFHVHPWNANEDELVYRQRDRFAEPSPAAVQDILGIFATRTGLARDGIRYKGFAKLLFQSATIRTAIKHGNYVESPSMSMQKVLASTLGLLGELLGYKAVQPKYVGE